jgi:hypothetical protein
LYGDPIGAARSHLVALVGVPFAIYAFIAWTVGSISKSGCLDRDCTGRFPSSRSSTVLTTTTVHRRRLRVWAMLGGLGVFEEAFGVVGGLDDRGVGGQQQSGEHCHPP